MNGQRAVTVAATVFVYVVTTLFLLEILSSLVYHDRNEYGTRRKRIVKQWDMQSKPRKKADIPYLNTNQPFKYDSEKSYILDSLLQKLLKTHDRPGDDYYGFNLTRSDEILVTRDVIDERSDECKNRNFNYASLPTLSVVTPFHNEALTPLLRHVHAILSRTPPQLLMEIILVDDNSTFSYLGEDLQEYFRILDSRIRILRNKERKGLILSRLQGEEEARGEVVVFLDAHMEVCEGWAEPLLERIKNRPAIVVQAYITPIDVNTLALKTDDNVKYRGGFGWDMRYMWFPQPLYVNQFLENDWEPFPTPVLQGSCIAVRKSYFNAVGRFDPGLKIWGGEQFDLSFNVWMTGGKIETVPCSKVGHIFKDNKYSFGSEDKIYTITKNRLRVAEIWMDEFKHIVRSAVMGTHFPGRSEADFRSHFPFFTEAELKSMQDRKALRKKHNSKSFAWFLKTLMPEHKIPSREDVNSGEIRNVRTKHSFFIFEDGYIGTKGNEGGEAILVPDNTFALDKYGRLKYEDRCVGYGEWNLLVIKECPSKVGEKGFMPWTYDNNQLITFHQSMYLCATQAKSRIPIHTGQTVVQLQMCDEQNDDQRWMFMFTYG
ncbi:polypeptide N-acetylgalactosaminyltransferase 1-like [Haliotis cracherodii]|uniref:polypeptide N-acetylgalactosaminyltransferase 1-like n=1 Tax=Haliotis cracherodii TaxID=6455 RepID=UPI0039E9BE6D